MTLSTIDCQPANPDVVERLEEALERARAGDLSSVAIAVVTRDGSINGSCPQPATAGTLIGSIAALQAHVIESLAQE